MLVVLALIHESQVNEIKTEQNLKSESDTCLN